MLFPHLLLGRKVVSEFSETRNQKNGRLSGKGLVERIPVEHDSQLREIAVGFSLSHHLVIVS